MVRQIFYDKEDKDMKRKKIGYHEWYKDQKEYGYDHKLTDNWDPNGDYGNEYVDVHFRIECPSYTKTLCFENEEDRKAFDCETEKVFTSLGWKVERYPDNGVCMEVREGKQDLYLHPQDFSGVVKKSEVGRIAEALKMHDTFHLRLGEIDEENGSEEESEAVVDLYETIYDISDEEYEEMLRERKEKARMFLIQKAATKQRKYYLRESSIINDVALKVRLRRAGVCFVSCVSDMITSAFTQKVEEELIAEGWILVTTINGERYIRSANKSEQRARKLKEVIA